jgi:hypothetical protein
VAHWHGLAKLRMHNDVTLDVMDAVTVSLGDKLREFNERTCTAFVTRELQREFNARMRREANKRPRTGQVAHPQQVPHAEPSNTNGDNLTQPSSTGGTTVAGAPSNSNARSANARCLKSFNLNTYKVHALGDYTATIRRYGTTDSYSTEPVRNDIDTL